MKTEMVSSLMWVKDSPLNGKEFDTYKIGTTANSTSTMHKIKDIIIDQDCFELDDFDGDLGLLDDVPIGLRVA